MGRTVVIVDDHAEFRDVAAVVLAAGGFDVVGTAGTGREGLSVVTATRPDVVLLDITLPDVDGFEVCRMILRVRPATVVVLCSSRAAADYGPHVQQSSAAGFISKGELTAAALRQAVAAHLG